MTSCSLPTCSRNAKGRQYFAHTALEFFPQIGRHKAQPRRCTACTDRKNKRHFRTALTHPLRTPLHAPQRAAAARRNSGGKAGKGGWENPISNRISNAQKCATPRRCPTDRKFKTPFRPPPSPPPPQNPPH